MNAGASRRMAAFALLAGAVLLLLDLSVPSVGPAHPLSVTVRAGMAASCHQQPSRCFRFNGEPLPVCARCSGLHASGLLGGALLLLLPSAAARRLPRPRPLAGLALAPLLLDVALGVLFEGWDHPWLRAATGLWAGTALLLTLRTGEKEGTTA